MIKPLEFYFDFVSPYSYLAYQEIKKIEKKESTRMKYKPILLGGLHNLHGIKAPAFVPAKAKFMIRDCKMVAKKLNIKFKFNPLFPINSINLMRGLLAANPKIRDKYIDIFFDAYWESGLDLSDEKIISHLLKKILIKKNFFLQKINEQSIKDKLRKLTQEAYKCDVFGAPTYVVNKKIFWGQDRFEYAIDEYYRAN